MAEAARILAGIASGQPVNAAELATARDDMSLGLSSAWATNNGIGQYLMDQQAYDLPDDYYARYPASVGALSLDAVNAEGAGLIGQRTLTRSEERGGGKECVGTGRYRWSPSH